jgi:hypothetical protein
VWGLVTVPGFSTPVGYTVAELCRATPTGTVDSLSVRWDAMERLASIGAGRAQSAAMYAWSAVADSVVDGRVQDRTGVRRAAYVEAAPDDQLDVVAPDVHMRSPRVLRLATTDCRTGRSVAPCQRTGTEFHPMG